ncbi:MAG: 4Fe-4S binding protein [Candidatus Hydrogenedentes bacterium]|nr:4Fe-4S binding protein [Candidatus Hydrogenedentota bacterium]
MKRIVLSNLRPPRSVVYWRWFPEAVQALLLAVFIALIAYGWGRYTPEGVNDKLYAKSNIVNLLVWGLWWPTMILAAVLQGRAWCAVCPLELVSSVSESLTSRIGIPPRKVTRWMRAGWLILLLYGVAQMMISAAHMHRVPMYTSMYLLVMLVLSVLMGLFFRDRAYCRALCPVGLLLKVYGRGGALAVRPSRPGLPADSRLSQTCRTLLNPIRLDRARGDECLMCLDCVQADREEGRMQLQLRAPWNRHDQRPLLADWPVTLFIMMVSGFVTSEISGLSSAADAAFAWAPSHIGVFAGLGASNGWIMGVWTIIIFPLLLWTVLGLVAMPFVRSRNLGAIWRSMALPVSLIIMAAHMTKAFEKLSTWGGYLPLALHDPAGEATARGITEKVLAPPSALVGMPVILSIGTLLLIAALYVMRRETGLHTASRTQDPCYACVGESSNQ